MSTKCRLLTVPHHKRCVFRLTPRRDKRGTKPAGCFPDSIGLFSISSTLRLFSRSTHPCFSVKEFNEHAAIMRSSQPYKFVGVTSPEVSAVRRTETPSIKVVPSSDFAIGVFSLIKTQMPKLALKANRCVLDLYLLASSSVGRANEGAAFLSQFMRFSRNV